MDIDTEKLRAGDRQEWNQAHCILMGIGMFVCEKCAPTMNYQDYEDVVMEAFGKIRTYVKQGKSFEECKRLFVTICKNRLRDFFRRQAREKHGGGHVGSLDAEDGIEVPDDQGITPDEAVIIGEQLSSLKIAMGKISKNHRTVVEESYYNGLTQQQIADKHGLKLGSIGVLLGRAIDALRKHLPQKENLL